MNQDSQVKKFFSIVLPTPVQAAVSLFVSICTIIAFERQALIQHFTGENVLLPTATKQFNLQVLHFLGLNLVGQTVIIVFWAIIGLGAYLIVWFLHNGLINVRNQVIIRTEYTNQKKSGFDIKNILLKIALLISAVISIGYLPVGFNFWLRLWQELLNTQLNWHAALLATGSVLGFAGELYLSFLLFQAMVDRFRR